jgi:hypothetical protein
MQFNPDIHTKEFLLKDPKVVFELAGQSSEFALSSLVNDFDLLSLADKDGATVAHYLAQHQPEWLRSEASNSPEILRLANEYGNTVAHILAIYQPEWLRSEASNSPEVLRLADKYGWTVAFKILIHQSESVYHQPLMKKQILTLEDCFNCLLAETFTQNYGDTHGLDTSTMAMKLIEQGAAYKHSKPMVLKVGETLLNHCKVLIEDNLDAQISLNQLMATYSTFHHNVAKIISTKEQRSLQQWQDILLKSETLLCQHLNAYPDLCDVEYTVDIFCEPADVLLKKIQSERILGQNLSEIQDSIHTTEIEPIKPAIY